MLCRLHDLYVLCYAHGVDNEKTQVVYLNNLMCLRLRERMSLLVVCRLCINMCARNLYTGVALGS